MAEVLPHPDKDRDFTKSVFHLPGGSVSVTTRDQDVLTAPAAILMLHQAIQIIIDESLGG
jgi:hypothetical protein